MKLYHLPTGLLRVNTYFIVNDDGDAVVIDCGENYKKIKSGFIMKMKRRKKNGNKDQKKKKP